MPALPIIWALVKSYLPQIGIALAILAGVAYLERDGYRRAEAAQAAREAKIEAKIDAAISGLDQRTALRLSAIGTTDRTVIQPILTREITNEPRYSDPACSLTVGVRSALDQARALSGTAGADSGAVPAPAHAN